MWDQKQTTPLRYVPPRHCAKCSSQLLKVHCGLQMTSKLSVSILMSCRGGGGPLILLKTDINETQRLQLIKFLSLASSSASPGLHPGPCTAESLSVSSVYLPCQCPSGKLQWSTCLATLVRLTWETLRNSGPKECILVRVSIAVQKHHDQEAS